MESILWASLSAFWLGILTSISPCPLATNVAAVSFIGQQVQSTLRAFVAGLLYTLGRMITYIALGAVVTAGLLSRPAVSNFLQDYMNLILGPLLILTGLFLLGIFRFVGFGFAPGGKTQSLARRGTLWGAALLGFLFALSLCPVSAALFFGSLLPLAIKHHSYLLLPSLYGIGTGLPVLAFAFLIALGIGSVGRIFHSLSRIEKWLRRLTAVVFIAVGLYYMLIYIFKVPI